MRRLFSIGEALIDFIPNVTNANLKDVQTFTKQIGGRAMQCSLYSSKVRTTSVYDYTIR
ncbi:hypothetical protein [Staphylococcus aureus]|uniref:hypothetical protein n=1 Tax=Staphylococcus aureus TaxID=1280 RepID=UPI000DFF28D2|nr:hypothetical protein [Staphylococcus aureus]SUJ54434.1 Fructokinase [Staphylococcus aureus]